MRQFFEKDQQPSIELNQKAYNSIYSPSHRNPPAHQQKGEKKKKKKAQQARQIKLPKGGSLA